MFVNIDGVRIAKSKYAGGRLYGVLFKLILIALGAIIPLLTFVSTFKIECNYLAVVISAIAGAIIFSSIISGKKFKIYILIGMTILLVIYIICFNSELKNAILNIANIILKEYSDYFRVESSYFEIGEVNHKLNNTLLICGIVFEYTFILAASTWYKLYSWIHIIGIVIFVGPVLLLGHMPEIWCMIGLMVYIMSVICVGKIFWWSKSGIKVKSTYKINDCINAKIFVVIALIIAVISFCTIMLVEPVGYNRDVTADEVGEFLERNIEQLFDIKIFNWGKGKTASGGISGGRLGQTDSLEFNNKSVMKITVPADSEGFYIRGFTGTKYSGNSWIPVVDDMEEKYEKYNLGNTDYFSETYAKLIYKVMDEKEFANMYQSRMEDTFKIEITSADKNYFYSPYFSDLSGYKKEYDIRITDKMPDTVNFQFFNYLLSKNYDELCNSLFIYDASYEKYIDEVYQSGWGADISEKIYNELALMYNEELIMFDGSNYQACIDAVKEYLNKNMVYSLKPGRLEEGQDFLERFLFVTKAGYCSHFATAATVMLRAEGIPARYVEGYVVPKEYFSKNLVSKEKRNQVIDKDGTKGIKEYYTIDVKDTCAHAWTEIYVNGFGWVPVEVTPGYNNVIEGEIETTDNQQTQKPTTSGQRETTTRKKTVPTTNEKNKNVSDRLEKDYKVVMYVLISVLVLAALGVIIYLLIKKHYEKIYNMLHAGNPRNNLQFAYKYFMKFYEIKGIEISEKYVLEEVAEKVSESFGIDEKEIKEVCKLYDKLHFASGDTEFSEEERELVLKVLTEMMDICYEESNIITKIKLKLAYPVQP